MHIPKKYGHGRNERCPFCGNQAIALNPQGVPTCTRHSTNSLENLRCACGKELTPMQGKYGMFFNCINCGNISLRKVLEINS